MATKIKGLQQWCRKMTDGYPNVDIANFTTAWRNGLAFCAIIHRFRPDLIDFDSLTPDNVLENNKLAFEIAEKELNIPSFLEAEDMARLQTPDKLSVITYVSQYYNFLNHLPQLGGPGVRANKTPGGATKRPLTYDQSQAPSHKKSSTEVSKQGNEKPVTRTPAGSTGDKCSLCQNKVYLLERHMDQGKLYHRSCFRHSELSPTNKVYNRSPFMSPSLSSELSTASKADTRIRPGQREAGTDNGVTGTNRGVTASNGGATVNTDNKTKSAAASRVSAVLSKIDNLGGKHSLSEPDRQDSKKSKVLQKALFGADSTKAKEAPSPRPVSTDEDFTLPLSGKEAKKLEKRQLALQASERPVTHTQTRRNIPLAFQQKKEADQNVSGSDKKVSSSYKTPSISLSENFAARSALSKVAGSKVADKASLSSSVASNEDKSVDRSKTTNKDNKLVDKKAVLPSVQGLKEKFMGKASSTSNDKPGSISYDKSSSISNGKPGSVSNDKTGEYIPTAKPRQSGVNISNKKTDQDSSKDFFDLMRDKKAPTPAPRKSLGEPTHRTSNPLHIPYPSDVRMSMTHLEVIPASDSQTSTPRSTSSTSPPPLPSSSPPPLPSSPPPKTLSDPPLPSSPPPSTLNANLTATHPKSLKTEQLSPASMFAQVRSNLQSVKKPKDPEDNKISCKHQVSSEVKSATTKNICKSTPSGKDSAATDVIPIEDDTTVLSGLLTSLAGVRRRSTSTPSPTDSVAPTFLSINVTSANSNITSTNSNITSTKSNITSTNSNITSANSNVTISVTSSFVTTLSTPGVCTSVAVTTSNTTSVPACSSLHTKPLSSHLIHLTSVDKVRQLDISCKTEKLNVDISASGKLSSVSKPSMSYTTSTASNNTSHLNKQQETSIGSQVKETVPKSILKKNPVSSHDNSNVANVNKDSVCSISDIKTSNDKKQKVPGQEIKDLQTCGNKLGDSSKHLHDKTLADNISNKKVLDDKAKTSGTKENLASTAKENGSVFGGVQLRRVTPVSKAENKEHSRNSYDVKLNKVYTNPKSDIPHQKMSASSVTNVEDFLAKSSEQVNDKKLSSGATKKEVKSLTVNHMSDLSDEPQWKKDLEARRQKLREKIAKSEIDSLSAKGQGHKDRPMSADIFGMSEEKSVRPKTGATASPRPKSANMLDCETGATASPRPKSTNMLDSLPHPKLDWQLEAERRMAALGGFDSDNDRSTLEEKRHKRKLPSTPVDLPHTNGTKNNSKEEDVVKNEKLSEREKLKSAEPNVGQGEPKSQRNSGEVKQDRGEDFRTKLHQLKHVSSSEIVNKNGYRPTTQTDKTKEDKKNIDDVNVTQHLNVSNNNDNVRDVVDYNRNKITTTTTVTTTTDDVPVKPMRKSRIKTDLQSTDLQSTDLQSTDLQSTDLQSTDADYLLELVDDASMTSVTGNTGDMAETTKLKKKISVFGRNKQGSLDSPPSTPTGRKKIEVPQIDFDQTSDDLTPTPTITDNMMPSLNSSTSKLSLDNVQTPPPREVSATQRSVTSPGISAIELQQQLMDIDSRLTDLELRGRDLEDSIRNVNSLEEDDDPLMKKWFQLVSEKNDLVRQEADLVYLTRETDLESEQDQVESQLRYLMALPDGAKSPEERQEEGYLIQRKLELVDQRDCIVNSIDEDRLRYLEEDRGIEVVLRDKGLWKDSNGTIKALKGKKVARSKFYA